MLSLVLPSLVKEELKTSGAPCIVHSSCLVSVFSFNYLHIVGFHQCGVPACTNVNA